MRARTLPHRVYRQPLNVEDWDVITTRFIRMVCTDAELDYNLSRLLMLFAVDMPETQGGYAHHGH